VVNSTFRGIDTYSQTESDQLVITEVQLLTVHCSVVHDTAVRADVVIVRLKVLHHITTEPPCTRAERYCKERFSIFFLIDFFFLAREPTYDNDTLAIAAYNIHI